MAEKNLGGRPRGSNWRCFEQGDWVILKIAAAGDAAPEGALLPLQPVRHFEQFRDASRWVKENADELSTGRYVIVRFARFLNIEVRQRLMAEIEEQPRFEPPKPPPPDQPVEPEPADVAAE